MATFVDGVRDWGWRLGPSCHLGADSLDELHAFAAKLGLRRAWFQDGKRPHYDLTAKRRAMAVGLGAVEMNGGTFLKRLKEMSDASS